MGEALRAAATDAGLRLTLLDTCYLAGGIGQPLEGAQLRFGDGTVDAWASRMSDLAPDRSTRIGVAIHSVRAVAADDLAVVVAAAGGRPLHAHVSEQPGENEQCLAAYGCTPTRLLHEHGVLSDRTTAVHATHLTDDDIALLGAQPYVVLLLPHDRARPGRRHRPGPPARRRRVAAVPRQRPARSGRRLRGGPRARGARAAEQPAARPLRPSELVDALTWQGHAAIGWPEAGRIAVGAPADLVAVSTGSVRTAGSRADQVVFSATASRRHRRSRLRAARRARW